MILLRGLVLGPPRIIGLDVGTTTIKAARVRRSKDRFDVLGLAQATIGQDPSAARTQESVSAAIGRCLKEMGSAESVVCGLSGTDVAVRTFDLPALPGDQLKSAVELEAAQVCPFDIQEAVIAFQVLRGTPVKASRKDSGKPHDAGSGKTERIGGILAAAKKDVVARLQQSCRQSEVTCMMVDVDGLALLNCLQACRICPPGETSVVMNIGATYTNMAILSDDGSPFVQDIAYAGQDITNHLCKSAGADRQAVIAFLGKSEEKNAPSEALQSGLKQACSPLAERVKETLRYHVARKSGPGVNRVLVCGGLGQAPRFVKTLGGLLERPVESWNPLASLSVAESVRKSESAQHGPQFAVALGLAMRSVHDVQD
jgi:type IV pilus assembly protein PilM